MGQEIVEKFINKCDFTTFDELKNLIDKKIMGEQSLIKALGKLKKQNEVITFKISRQTVYFNPIFYEKIGDEK